jgi:hypothetical protein
MKTLKRDGDTAPCILSLDKIYRDGKSTSRLGRFTKWEGILVLIGLGS